MDNKPNEWSIKELDKAKLLYDFTSDHYKAMLTSAKFRPDIRSNSTIEAKMIDKLSLSLTSVAKAQEKWYDTRATAEKHKNSGISTKVPSADASEEHGEESRTNKHPKLASPLTLKRGPDSEPSLPREPTPGSRDSTTDTQDQYRSQSTQTGITSRGGPTLRHPPGFTQGFLRARLPSPGLSKVAAWIHNGKQYNKRINIDLLLDCGCATNVLDHDAAVEAQLDIFSAENVSLVDAAGAHMAVSGQALIKVEPQNRAKSAFIKFIISPDLPHREAGMIGKVALQTLGYLPKNWPESLNFSDHTEPPHVTEGPPPTPQDPPPSLAALADKARRLPAQPWAQPSRSPTTLYRFRAESQLGRLLMVQGAHGIEYLMKLLQTAVSQRCRTDPTDSTTIKCGAELADTLGRSSFHVWELRTLLMTHVIKLPETVAARSPSGVIVPTEGVGIGVYISHTDFFTLREDFHRLLRLTPGAVQGRNLYLFQEVLNLTHDYLKTSPLFEDPRSPQSYFLGDDPMASILGSRSFHKSQIPRLVQPMLQSTPQKVPAQRKSRAPDLAEGPSGRAAPPPPPSPGPHPPPQQ
jgi:hypothetical protein